MNSILADMQPPILDQPVVAGYRNHFDATTAVRCLAAGGFALNKISIIGRNFETHEDIQGFYKPADAALDGAGEGAWVGGIFGLMFGAMGFFVLPLIGSLMVLGPLSSMIAGAIGGAGVGALINGLVAAGIPKDHALKFQERLQAGEFLVVVHGGENEASRARELLKNTKTMELHSFGKTPPLLSAPKENSR
jgi:hypothetical protein